MNHFLHSGCLGDILYALPSIIAIGGGHFYYDDRPWTAPLLPKIHNLLSLLELQPCITGVSQYKGEPITHDFSTYRFGGLRYGDTIIERQARWLRVNVSSIIKAPWLTVDYTQRIAPIVISRGPRWNGFFFPWSQILARFGDNIVFVGSSEDHQSFEADFGRVPWHPTPTLLDMARIIAGADLFIGTQSCPLAIAEGLHKRTIVDVCCWALDCMHLRPGNIHVIGGSLQFAFRGHEFYYASSRKHATAEQERLIARAKYTYSELLAKV